MKITSTSPVETTIANGPSTEQLIKEAFADLFPPRQSAIYAPDFSTLKYALEGGAPLGFTFQAKMSVGGIAGNIDFGTVTFFGQMRADGKGVESIKLVRTADSDWMGPKPPGEPATQVPVKLAIAGAPLATTLATLEEQRFQELPYPLVEKNIKETIAQDPFFGTLSVKSQAALAKAVLTAAPRVPTEQSVQWFMNGLLDQAKNANVTRVDVQQGKDSASVELTFTAASTSHHLISSGKWDDGVYTVRLGDLSELGAIGMAVVRSKNVSIPLPASAVEGGAKIVVVNQDGSKLAETTLEAAE